MFDRTSISKGSSIAKAAQLGKIPPVVYTLLPRTTPSKCSVTLPCVILIDAIIEHYPINVPYDSFTNTFNYTYYGPELRLVIERYRSLEHDKKALDRFVQQQQTLATQLMQARG
jgi:hypothetical protein